MRDRTSRFKRDVVFAIDGDGPEDAREDSGESASAEDGGNCSVRGGGAGRRFCSRSASDSVGVGGVAGALAELAKEEERRRGRMEHKQVLVAAVVDLILALLPICSILPREVI